MGALQSFVDWIYEASASPIASLNPKVQLVLIALLGIILFYFFLIFRPTPALGEVIGPQNDEEGRGGTEHWSTRTIANRGILLALPVLKAVALVAMALVFGLLLLGYFIPIVGETDHGFRVIYPLYTLVVIWLIGSRFWAMGRRARLKVIDSDDGTVRLNSWWVLELGLQENARLRLGGKLGQAEAGVFWIKPKQKRNEIGLPQSLKDRLGVLDGNVRTFALATTSGGAGLWPVLVAAPLAYGLWVNSSESGHNTITVASEQKAEPVSCSAPKTIEKIVEKKVPQIIDREICTLYFDLDKATLNEPAQRALATMDSKSHEPGVHVGIVGHTDTTGSAAYNQALSEARAETAAESLEAHGIPVAVIEGKGESQLEVQTPDETLEPRNRRTVITIDPPAFFSAEIPTQ